jgi:YbbR domain-containing protein
MLRWLTTNLRTFLLAFVLALAVWITAVTAADPDETQVFPRAIPIEFIGQDPSLIMTGTVPQQVNVTLRAPQSVWNQMLGSGTPIRAIADLTGIGSGQHTITVQLQITARPVRVVSVTPATLSLSLEPLLTLNLPIELAISGEPATGFQVGEATLDPTQVVVSGPQSLVSQVSGVRASLDVTNLRQSLHASVQLVAVTENDAALQGVAILPDTIQVTLPLVQQSGYRDLAVKVVTVGRVASGYRPTSVAAFPAIVTVYSENLALIDQLPGYVETNPLDLSGAKSDIETQLGLNLPSGVIVVGQQMVVVQVGVAPIEGTRPVSYRPVEIVGLGEGLKAQVSPETVDVILSGPSPVLDSLLSSDVQVRIDLTGLTPGTYQVTPTVSVGKQDVLVQSILPGTVEVIITAAEATPTPR